jgi:hypothetical protein
MHVAVDDGVRTYWAPRIGVRASGKVGLVFC